MSWLDIYITSRLTASIPLLLLPWITLLLSNLATFFTIYFIRSPNFVSAPL